MAINPKDVFDKVEKARKSGELSKMVTTAKTTYQASKTKPGLIEQIREDGQRVLGHFKDGKFIPETNK